MGNVQVPCLITRGFFYLCHEELSLVLRANACDPTPSKTPVHLKNLQKWKAPKNPLRSQLCQTNMKGISPKYVYIYIYMYIYIWTYIVFGIYPLLIPHLNGSNGPAGLHLAELCLPSVRVKFLVMGHKEVPMDWRIVCSLKGKSTTSENKLPLASWR